MFQDIVAFVFTLIVIVAGVWCYWVTNGGTFREKKQKEEKETTQTWQDM
ncbi:MAG: hypothetical protein Q4B72_04680 [Lachnospiraceae bacterium]|nr:hypothetical protein [Lachnospiraceae bacterium]